LNADRAPQLKAVVWRLFEVHPVGCLEVQMNRYRIIGAIAFVWGAALLLSHLLGFRRVEGSGAYASGQYAGLVFGGLLFAAGLYAVIVGGRKKKS
jgi:hypothetical protein